MVMISERIPLVVDQPMDVPFAPPSYEHDSGGGGSEQAANALTAALLGEPHIYYGGRHIAFRSKRVLALLVFLALTDQRQPRERIAALFWPDHDDLTARKLLRNVVVLLRHNLADATQIPYDDISIVRAEHDALGRPALEFDRSGSPSLLLDTEHVERAAAFARRLSQELLTAPDAQNQQMRDTLEAAVQLYHGPFLDGVVFDDAPELDDWIGQQRAYYQQQIEHVFGALTQLHMESGAFGQAATTARRWCEVNPFEEAATRYVMQGLAAQGDRAGALAAYTATKRLLRARLDVEPAPETVALAERLRHSASLASATTTQPTAPRSMRHPSLQRTVDVREGIGAPLVGRSLEFSALVSAYEMAKHHQPQIVVLGGETGIGKSRLAEAFLCWVGTQGAAVLQARALEFIGHLPFQPLVDAIRPRIAQENAPDDLLADPWLAELTRLFPELRDRYPDLPAPSEMDDGETTARGRLFEAVTQLVRALSERSDTHGLVLFLDNAQWVDTATRDLLQYAVRNWMANGTPVLLVLGARSEASRFASELHNWLASLERETELHRLLLRPLTPEDTHRLLSGLGTWEYDVVAGHGNTRNQSEALITWLHRRTGGQPFYLLQMVRTLLEHGVIRREQTREGQAIVALAAPFDGSALAHIVPGTVRDLVRSRLSEAPETATDLLTAASVLGRPATFDQLRTLIEVSERDALDALDDLLHRRLLVLAPREERVAAEGSRQSRYMFPQELLSEVVYTEAGEERRRIFHARAFHLFAALEREGSTTTSATIPTQAAHHALMAGLLEPAFRYSLRAGDAALQTLGMDEAIALYEQALRIAQELNAQALARGIEACVSKVDLERLYTQLVRTGRDQTQDGNTPDACPSAI